ncbi:hypothetical protein PJ311_16515 [Bacillus sp. CLL-7-23]|uniref:Lipoprotein n=1 Tax=Bacillus changyiensis TaxID=3004103 RepID=A0ABT4X7G4_9BACI|nr:hypothetical protein [Bacillus changyiensis]MDA7028178.1 hypothetical protein [Bacillus changyiensis]
MNRLKTLFVLSSILIVTCSCQQQSVGHQKEKVNTHQDMILRDIKKGAFIVSFSNMLNSGSEFAVYQEGGAIQDQITLKDHTDLNSSASNQDYTFFASNRSNDHMKINNKTGKLDKINEKSLSKTTEDEGAIFINTSGNYVLHDINIGNTGDGLHGELVYWNSKMKNKKHLIISGEIVSAQIVGQKIYAITNKNDHMSIVLINSKTNKPEIKKRIPNEKIYFLNKKDGFQVLDEQTFMLAVNDQVEQNQKSKILLIDQETLKTKREIKMEKGFFPTKLKRIKDEVVAVSSNGKVTVFDHLFHKKRSFNVFTGNDDYSLEDVKINDHNIYALTKRFKRDKQKLIGNIISYNLKSGKKEKTTPLKANQDWDFARFELLPNK